MNRARRTLSLLVLPFALSTCASVGSAPPRETKMADLLRQPLAAEFTAGREVIVSLVEIPPNTTLERHFHPGEEFHYYLEGRVEIAIEGEPSRFGTPGSTGHIPYRKLHTAITRDEGAKVLVFRVHASGEPVRYLEGETPAP